MPSSLKEKTMAKQSARLSEEAITLRLSDPPEPIWISVAKAAKRADVAPKTIRAHIITGEIQAVFAGRVLRVDQNSVDAWLRPVEGIKS